MAVEPESPSAPRRTAWQRHVTLLFSDLIDSTTMAERLPPEDYLDVLDHLRRCVDVTLARHEGTLVNVQGDGFLAMFGFPDASEHDGRRATEAALELHDAIASAGATLPASVQRPLRMHSGIHSGLVLVIAEGEPPLYLLAGDAPNVAARLSKAGQPGEILVSATTLGTERHFFELLDRGELKLEGKTEPVPTFQVLCRAPVATRFEARTQHGLTPFEGRAAEMAVLDRALDAATAGRLQMVSIVGSAGIGKTRLAEEFLRHAADRGCAVHRAYCDEHSAEPLHPIRQMFRTASAPLPPVNPAAALRDLFSSMAAARPIVMFIDDWQWADDATRSALAGVRELDTSAILILTTSRLTDEQTGDRNFDSIARETRLVLSPLDEEAELRTIRALRPAADPFVVRRVQEMSGGNPLFIEELCHGASSRDVADVHFEGRGSRPAWLSTVIESRVARLPVEQANIVRTATVIGMAVPAYLLEQLTGYDEQHPLVRELADRDLIFPGDAEHTLRFKHGITREVIYESLGIRWRQQKHLQIAELLEKHNPGAAIQEQFEALAYHYRAAARASRAAEYAERAGDKALGAAALDRARTQYAVALELIQADEPDQYARWVAIAQRFGLACVYDPGPEQLPILQRAVDLAAARGDAAALARTRYWLGYVHYSLGQLGLAIRHLEEARASCEDAGDAAALKGHALQVQATLGQAHAAACEYDDARRHLEDVIAVKEREGRPPTVGSAYTRACLGAVLGDLGRFDEAHASFANALEAVREGNHPVKGSVLGLQGLVFVWQRRWADALACGTEAQQIGERVESLYVLAINQTLRGYARWKLERAPEAIDAILGAVSWLEARDKRLFLSTSCGWLAEAMLETGRYAEARAHAGRAIRRARQRDRFGEAAAYRVLAQLPEAYRHRPVEHYLQRSLAAARFRRSPHEEALTLDVAASLQRSS